MKKTIISLGNALSISLLLLCISCKSGQENGTSNVENESQSEEASETESVESVLDNRERAAKERGNVQVKEQAGSLKMKETYPADIQKKLDALELRYKKGEMSAEKYETERRKIIGDQ